MRLDDLTIALQKRRGDIERNVFQHPPVNYEAYIKQLGVWIGLGDALGIVEDARKAEYGDD